MTNLQLALWHAAQAAIAAEQMRQGHGEVYWGARCDEHAHWASRTLAVHFKRAA